MKLLALILALIVTSASSYLIKVKPVRPATIAQEVLPKSRWVNVQKLVLLLFEDVCEESTDPVIVRSSQEFSLNSTSDDYWKPEVLRNLQTLKSVKGLLSKGEIFSEYKKDHLNELKIIFETLRYARHFDVFFKAASWARQNLNCGLYINALYMAILHKSDMDNILVPPPYEILPNYFITEDVISTASSLLAGEEVELSDIIRNEGNAYILNANYTASFYKNDYDTKLAYFHEDIGLNSYYYFTKLRNSPWVNNPNDMSIRYGENIYHVMKQLTTRCNLERYANGLPELESIDMNIPMDYPYDSRLIYSNGNEFPKRSSILDLSNVAEVDFIENVEENLTTIVNHLRQLDYNKTQILNHIMDILVISNKSYEYYARYYLGQDFKPETGSHSVSVIEHYMTSVRDPMFWKINKKIVEIVDEALEMLPSYSRSELYFPGVKINNVDVKKMVTNFDSFQFDVTESLRSINSTPTFQVKIEQPRLNHKPFTIKLNISSLVVQKGLIKLYIGPRTLPGELVSNKNTFMMLDSFEVNLKIGKNLITRSSEEITNLSEDMYSSKTLVQLVRDAEFGIEALSSKNIESLVGFPTRLILPKGCPGGLPLQMFVFIAPFVKASIGVNKNIDFNSAILSPGYPLDLNVEENLLFSLPNAFLKDVVVTHKKGNYGEGLSTKIWSENTYEPSSKGTYEGRKSESFDYNINKEKYGKNKDNSLKDIDINEGSDEEELTILPRNTKNDENDKEDPLPKISLLGLRPEPFDYISKSNQFERKKYFDYNSKKGQYGKKDQYSTRPYKYNKNIEGVNDENTTKIETVITPNIDLTNDTAVQYTTEYINENQDQEEVKIENKGIEETTNFIPILRLSSQNKRVPNVYDYIIKSIVDDDTDDTQEVYE